jgi:hypothetical protein
MLVITGLCALSACAGTDFYDVGLIDEDGTSGSSFGGAPSSTGGGAGESVSGMGNATGLAGAGPVATPVLCNGSDSLRFAAQSSGGNVTGIPTLVLETGFEFLLIDGGCRYYAMTEANREIRTGVLTAADAKSLSNDFLLGHWQELVDVGLGCPDAGSEVFAYGQERARSSCTSTPLTRAFTLWLERLYDAGSKVGGEVRYGVLESSNFSWPQSSPQLALPYPFKDPAPIATDPFLEMNVQLASGADAATLRELRAAYHSGTKPVPDPSYSIPVKVEGANASNAPTYYSLVMRDTVPFETNGVLAIDDFIE